MLQKNRKKHIINSTIFFAILLSIFTLVMFNQQVIVDQITVWQYVASDEVESLADKSGMNSYGKFLFYASKPKLDATQNFNNVCDRIEVMTSILGCYSNSNIYIYNVTDKKLDGIREVTATHEMLHAVYSRLSDTEKQEISVLLEEEFLKIQNNQDYKERMEFYERTEPGERYNELHSIIGTEISIINQKLENYYSKYFSNRQKVVQLNAKYIAIFTQLKSDADKLVVQMDQISLSIKNDTETFNSDVEILNADVSAFNIRADAGLFESQARFNYERNLLTKRVSELDKLKALIGNNIAKYDLILNEYNSIASESKKLYNSIDSTLAATPSV